MLALRKSIRICSSHQCIPSSNFASHSAVAEEVIIKLQGAQVGGKLWNKDGKKTPIVALHGWLDNAATWDTVCPLLSPDIPIFSVDFPGTGYSTVPPGMGSQVTDGLITIHQVLNYFNWSKVNLLGHSMGAGIGMLYAGTFPNVVENLIMMDLIKLFALETEKQPKTTGVGVQERVKIYNTPKREPRKYAFEDLVKKMVNDYQGSVTEDSARILLARGTHKHSDGLFSPNIDAFLKAKLTLEPSLEHQLQFARNLKCNLVIIKASEGPLYDSVKNCQALLDIYEQICPQFHYLHVNGTHHMHLNDPQPIAQIVNGYLLENTVPTDKLRTSATYFQQM